MADAISYWGTNEDDLKALLVEYGPVVTTINASPLGNYNGGIFSSWTCCDAASGGENCTYVISVHFLRILIEKKCTGSGMSYTAKICSGIVVELQ